MEVKNAVDFSCLLPVTLYKKIYIPPWGFPGGSDSKKSTCNAGDPGSTPGLGRSPGEGNSSILAWRIPQTEEPGGLQSMGLQRVEHNWVNNTHIPPCYIYFTEILSYYRYWTLSQWLLYLASTARWRDTISPFQVHDCKPANRLIAKSSRWDLTQTGGSGVQKKATMQRFLCQRESGWI